LVHQKVKKQKVRPLLSKGDEGMSPMGRVQPTRPDCQECDIIWDIGEDSVIRIATIFRTDRLIAPHFAFEMSLNQKELVTANCNLFFLQITRYNACNLQDGMRE